MATLELFVSIQAILTQHKSLQLEEAEIISYLLSWRPADLIRGFKTDFGNGLNWD
jgi:hypothetical protein